MPRKRLSWLIEPCPAWCRADHHDQDHPDDRFHQSPQILVPVVIPKRVTVEEVSASSSRAVEPGTASYAVSPLGRDGRVRGGPWQSRPYEARLGASTGVVNYSRALHLGPYSPNTGENPRSAGVFSFRRSSVRGQADSWTTNAATNPSVAHRPVRMCCSSNASGIIVVHTIASRPPAAIVVTNAVSSGGADWNAR